MEIFGLAGWSGSGKTTLMVGLLPELVARGLTVSTMKHAHHTFDTRWRRHWVFRRRVPYSIFC